MIEGSELFPILATLHSLKHIRLTGHDKSRGRVSSKALSLLALSTSLRQLDLYDQTVRTRDGNGIWVFSGDTVGNSISAQIIAQESGIGDSEMSEEYFNGKKRVEKFVFPDDPDFDSDDYGDSEDGEEEEEDEEEIEDKQDEDKDDDGDVDEGVQGYEDEDEGSY